MVLSKIGEFLTSISVNGSDQGSWNQSDNSNYDISVSASHASSINWYSVASATRDWNDGSSYEQIDSFSIGSTKYLNINVSTNGSNDYKIEDSSGTILYTNDGSGNGGLNAFGYFGADTYTLYGRSNDPVDADVGWDVDEANNVVQVSYRNGTHVLPRPNTSVDGVNKQ